ncbi:MAG: hypothetical protein R6X02_26755 [Enhygromyxa sp.]
MLLFRTHPELAFELARRAGASMDAPCERIEVTAAEIDDPVTGGNTVRADLALVSYDGDDAQRALAIEVQLGPDKQKQWSTVLYRAGLRYNLSCPAWTLYFSPDAQVRESVYADMFVHEPELRPLVVTPAMIDPIRDLDAAIADYPWAVLSAVMHADCPDAVVLATVAIQAVLRVAPQDYWRYIQLVEASVGEEVMQQVRAQLPANEQEELSQWERRGSSFTRGRAEGLAEGLERMRAALRAVLETRGLSVDDQVQRWIADCSDLDALRDAIVRATTVSCADELLSH